MERIAFDNWGARIVRRDGRLYLEYDVGHHNIDMVQVEISEAEAEQVQRSEADAYAVILKTQNEKRPTMRPGNARKKGGTMRTILKVLAVLVIGTVLGLGVTWLTVVRGTMGGDVGNGPWRTSLATESNAGSAALRASVAVHGLLALNRSETIYYTAATDSGGAPLSGSCIYTIEMGNPPARWWSITAYGADDYLIPNREGRYSASMNSVKRGADGSFFITVAKERLGDNFIPVGDGPFNLTLRLYNPAPAVAADPAHVALPHINREPCR